MDMSEIKKRHEAAKKKRLNLIKRQKALLAKSKAKKEAEKKAAALKRKNLKETQGNLKGQQAAIKLGDTENRKGRQVNIPASKPQTGRLGTVATVAAIQAIPIGKVVNGISKISKNLYKIGKKTYNSAAAARKAKIASQSKATSSVAKPKTKADTPKVWPGTKATSTTPKKVWPTSKPTPKVEGPSPVKGQQPKNPWRTKTKPEKSDAGLKRFLGKTKVDKPTPKPVPKPTSQAGKAAGNAAIRGQQSTSRFLGSNAAKAAAALALVNQKSKPKPEPKPTKKKVKNNLVDQDSELFDNDASIESKTTDKPEKDPHWREIKKVTKALGGLKYEVPETDDFGVATDPDMREAELTSDAKGGLIGSPRKTTKVKIKKKATSSTKKRKGFGGRGHGAALRGF